MAKKKKYPELATQEWSFKVISESPKSWMAQALFLQKAAARLDVMNRQNKVAVMDQIKSELFQMFPVYRMLMGMSMENLLKSIIISRGLPAGQDGKLDSTFNGHNLNGLASRVGFARDERERELFDELTEFITWLGRYPIPKRAEEWQCASHGSTMHKLEQEIWERLWEFAKDQLRPDSKLTEEEK